MKKIGFAIAILYLGYFLFNMIALATVAHSGDIGPYGTPGAITKEGVRERVDALKEARAENLDEVRNRIIARTLETYNIEEVVVDGMRAVRIGEDVFGDYRISFEPKRAKNGEVCIGTKNPEYTLCLEAIK